MEIPIDKLSPAALRGLVESFILREGTDYGAVERPFDEKVEEVLALLRAGRARIVWDEATESATLLPVE